MIAFRSKIPFTGAFCLTKDKALAAYTGGWTGEYATTTILSPTRVFKRTVNFPMSHTNLDPKPRAVVFKDDKETVDEAEMVRLQNAVIHLPRAATLIVNGPAMGWRYGISWMPPSGP
jgi:hypothetical protein